MARGHRFRNVNDMKIAVQRNLRDISTQDYRDALHSLPMCWMKCVKARGAYFEGQHLEINALLDHGLELVHDNSEDDN